MKILRVRFKNLNSLVGEWEIDLTHPAFSSDGIFAITGPTGAGKTTILDAICLALYGRTPRLDKVNQGGNEIMSRHTGECFAETSFETQAGRFRCHWSQRRSRKKPDGDLQPPKHEIANADSGEILESGIRGVAERIESATGMDFTRFTRSMLLAQGGFAAFLQAEADERAPILEQITGTKIYSDISIRVHERQRNEREKLDILQAETAGIVILAQEQEKEIQHNLETKRKENEDLAAKLEHTRKAIDWLTGMTALKKEITGLADEECRLRNVVDDFKPERAKLAGAQNAATLDGPYAKLNVVRKQQTEERTKLKTEENTLPELELSAKKQGEALNFSEQQTAKVKAELKDATPIIQQVRLLDQKLAHQKKSLQEDKQSCQKDKANIDADNKSLLKARQKQSEIEKNLQIISGYFEKHAKDEWLVNGLEDAQTDLRNLFRKQREITQNGQKHKDASTALEQATKLLDARKKQLAVCKQKLDDAVKMVQQGSEALNQLLGNRLLREYRAEKETLLREKVFLNKIMELEEHRSRLEDGRPCPLCGAINHPFAEGNVPVPDAIDQKIKTLDLVISKAEKQEVTIKKLEKDEAAAINNLHEGEKQEAAAANEQKNAEKTIVELKEGQEKLQADFAEMERAIYVKLTPLGITEIPDNGIESLFLSLKARRDTWVEQIGKKAEIEKNLVDNGNEITHLSAVVETRRIALNEKQERLKNQERQYCSECEERKSLYGDKNPDNEEKRLNKAVSDTEKTEKSARKGHEEQNRLWNAAKNNVESLKKLISEREPELQALEAEFSTRLKSAAFIDEDQFREACLTLEQRNELAIKAGKLDEAQTDLKARQKDRKTRLDEEIDKNITDKALDELEPQFKEYEESLKASRDIIAGLRHRLNENASAKERIKGKQAAIDAQKKECRRWETLHDLIGSANGKKYRNFAQGLTFDMMIGHANRQLRKMTDRYLLMRDDAQPLNLNVIDNYQAGEIRSAKNLSGGESFIVSLSLALGLSHMASKKMRVDSLFLDEGFGTLDDEALDTALEALAGIQQDGKLIGVISHVPALKERIGTQILVTPQAGGTSRITGPGCD